jgi:hypothetical protein
MAVHPADWPTLGRRTSACRCAPSREPLPAVMPRRLASLRSLGVSRLPGRSSPASSQAPVAHRFPGHDVVISPEVRRLGDSPFRQSRSAHPVDPTCTSADEAGEETSGRVTSALGAGLAARPDRGAGLLSHVFSPFKHGFDAHPGALPTASCRRGSGSHQHRASSPPPWAVRPRRSAIGPRSVGPPVAGCSRPVGIAGQRVDPTPQVLTRPAQGSWGS